MAYRELKIMIQSLKENLTKYLWSIES